MSIPEKENFNKCLAELVEDLVLSASESASFTSMYDQLYLSCTKLQDSKCSNQKRLKDLKSLLLQHEIEIERQSIRKVDLERAYHDLMMSKDQLKRNLASSQERRNQLNYELTEKKHDIKALARNVELTRKENENLFEPKQKSLEKEMARIKQENAAKLEAVEKERKLIDEQRVALEHLVADVEEKELLKAKLEVEFKKIKDDPERIRNQCTVVAKAIGNVETEIERLNDSVVGTGGYKEQLAKETRRRKAVDDDHGSLDSKIEQHQKNIVGREKEKAQAGAALEKIKQEESRLRESRVKVELCETEAEEEVKNQLVLLSRLQKEFELEKRILKKKRKVALSAKELLPNLKQQLSDARHDLDGTRSERRRAKKDLADVKEQRQKLTEQLMRKANISEERKHALVELNGHRGEMEQELDQWRFEEANMAKMIALLKAQRELKGREASKAAHLEMEAVEERKIKDLVILDLTKKLQEKKNSLRNFSALYDVVKNERNKYMNQTQASSQAVAEMKEKIKILMNEVEILRNENSLKDKVLYKERLGHQQSCNHRDQMRLEANRLQATYREKQELVEQHIVDIDKVNGIISGMESDMLSVKKRYEFAVEMRNRTGVQLVDRNDELCLLHDRSNAQEETLKRGEILLQELDQKVRMLRIDMAEMDRRIEITQRLVPEIRPLIETTERLQKDLDAERVVAEKLCDDLETPDNQDRWRLLKGSDPDKRTLDARTKVLEGRLHKRKEQLLEKEIILEEISSLSSKLRDAAEGGREHTLTIAKRSNELQSKIKEITRKMMSIVSELSMYQATAIKLQQDKEARQRQLDEAQKRFEAGKPPTQQSEREWHRLVQEKRRRIVEATRKKQLRAQDRAGLNPSIPIRTTAEPRPNAYVPEGDALGVPKPYGRLAPFKPTEPGSTMRHTRKPREREILI